MSFNGKGFTIEGLFKSLFTELRPGFALSSFKNFFKFSGWTFNIFFFAFELYYCLFHILMIKSSNRVDRALFNFLFNSFENSIIGHSLLWS